LDFLFEIERQLYESEIKDGNEANAIENMLANIDEMEAKLLKEIDNDDDTGRAEVEPISAEELA